MKNENLKQKKSKNLNEIENLKKEIKKFPKGKLLIVHNGKYIKWFHRYGKSLTYIPKKKRNLAELLSAKSYLQSQITDLNNENLAIDQYLKIFDSDKSLTKKLLQSNEHMELLNGYFTPDDLLGPEDHENEDYHPEALIHKSISGKLLRSKSEEMIDHSLYLHKLAYRYEARLELDNGHIVFPDFKIIHPRTKEIIYWEHFGMMDNWEYVQKNADKLADYIKSGYIPGINFITTYETINHPLTMEEIEDIIQTQFF